MHRRSGKSLVELMVVITVMSTMLFVAFGAINLLLRNQTLGNEQKTHNLNLSRLSRDFRDDVHAAAKAEVRDEIDGAPQCQLHLPDGRTVTYQADGARLTRIETKSEKTVRRDFYTLPEGETSYEHAAGSQLIAVTHRWTRSTTKEPDTPRELRLEATLSRDRRFERDAANNKNGKPEKQE